MRRRLLITRPALRDLESIDVTMRRRITGALHRLTESNEGDVKKLQGREAEWRLRVGDYRVLFSFQNQPPAIVVIRVLPRSRAYRD